MPEAHDFTRFRKTRNLVDSRSSIIRKKYFKTFPTFVGFVAQVVRSDSSSGDKGLRLLQETLGQISAEPEAVKKRVAAQSPAERGSLDAVDSHPIDGDEIVVDDSMGGDSIVVDDSPDGENEVVGISVTGGFPLRLPRRVLPGTVETENNRGVGGGVGMGFMQGCIFPALLMPPPLPRPPAPALPWASCSTLKTIAPRFEIGWASSTSMSTGQQQQQLWHSALQLATSPPSIAKVRQPKKASCCQQCGHVIRAKHWAQYHSGGGRLGPMVCSVSSCDRREADYPGRSKNKYDLCTCLRCAGDEGGSS